MIAKMPRQKRSSEKLARQRRISYQKKPCNNLQFISVAQITSLLRIYCVKAKNMTFQLDPCGFDLRIVPIGLEYLSLGSFGKVNLAGQGLCKMCVNDWIRRRSWLTTAFRKIVKSSNIQNTSFYTTKIYTTFFTPLKKNHPPPTPSSTHALFRFFVYYIIIRDYNIDKKIRKYFLVLSFAILRAQHFQFYLEKKHQITTFEESVSRHVSLYCFT